MGFFKNITIRRIANQRLDAIFKNAIKRLKKDEERYEDALLIDILKSTYHKNSDNPPWDKPDNMNEITYWVLLNIIADVDAELARKNLELHDADTRVITETVYKYLPAFMNFGPALIMSK